MSAFRNVMLSVAIDIRHLGAEHPREGVTTANVGAAKRATGYDLVTGVTALVAYDVSRRFGHGRVEALKEAVVDSYHDVRFVVGGDSRHYNMTS